MSSRGKHILCLLLALAMLFTGCQKRRYTSSFTSPRKPNIFQIGYAGIVHFARRWETVDFVSKSYGLSATELRRANNLGRNDSLKPGQMLFIPGASVSKSPKPDQGSKTPVVQQSKTKLPFLSAYSGPKTAKAIHPIKGSTLVRYQQKVDGVPSDGITFAAANGQQVWAVQDGIVRFSTNNFLNLGKVLFIEHPSGIWTLYGNLSEQIAQVGQKVSQGSVIARAGRSGNATRPQLHFRIYRYGNPVSPSLYLGH